MIQNHQNFLKWSSEMFPQILEHKNHFISVALKQEAALDVFLSSLFMFSCLSHFVLLKSYDTSWPAPFQRWPLTSHPVVCQVEWRRVERPEVKGRKMLGWTAWNLSDGLLTPNGANFIHLLLQFVSFLQLCFTKRKFYKFYREKAMNVQGAMFNLKSKIN